MGNLKYKNFLLPHSFPRFVIFLFMILLLTGLATLSWSETTIRSDHPMAVMMPAMAGVF